VRRRRQRFLQDLAGLIRTVFGRQDIDPADQADSNHGQYKKYGNSLIQKFQFPFQFHYLLLACDIACSAHPLKIADAITPSTIAFISHSNNRLPAAIANGGKETSTP
jgi:hypothetical protein